MLRTELDGRGWRRLRTISQSACAPWVRDRIEMLLLSARGWSPPDIGSYLDYDPRTVRSVLRAYQKQGVAALERQRPGPQPRAVHGHRVQRALRALLGRRRTWTSRQLSEALRPLGIRLSARQVRRYLHHIGAQWRRTVNSLDHKQNPELVEQARRHLSRLKKKPVEGSSICSSWMSAASVPRSPPGILGRWGAGRRCPTKLPGGDGSTSLPPMPATVGDGSSDGGRSLARSVPGTW